MCDIVAELARERLDVIDDVGNLCITQIVVRHDDGVADVLFLVGVLDRLNEIRAINHSGLAALERNRLTDDALPCRAGAATKIRSMAGRTT